MNANSNDHYYTKDPSSESKPVQARYRFRGHEFTLWSDAGVFSKGELDPGTDILLNALPENIQGAVLDLGCGWGPVGISLSVLYPDCHVTFTDINNRALSLSQRNADEHHVSGEFVQSDGFENINGVFDLIITNPPIRAGKQTIYKMFADSVAHLSATGALYIVIRKQQGAPSAVKYLSTLFTSVTIVERSGGYWVIRCSQEDNKDEI